MKKALTPFLFVALALPTLAFADTVSKTVPLAKVQAATGATSAQTVVNNNSTTVISPRTGISYTLGDTNGRPIILKTAAIAAATEATANRIVAANPALSPSSQEKAKQTLLASNLAPNSAQ
ncbi:hypothetical protein [Acinetobacter stercoris]|uniref:Lipoprotein n=1 Tax=Acinetobacter stercoris TaxID=2126983 RepID=A0A2U3N260_9GAMM|nr:hypothetical protein [Acinetobacter stercoris]SPL71751.1 hypothetical protein KPC_2929 [Acinetobacter stercoris]